MTLSADQQNVYNQLKNERKGCYLITGHAGCGKTFLAIKLIESFCKDGKKVLAVAPTHQAKLQFQHSLPEELDVETNTVASLLGAGPTEDPITGEIIFQSGNIDQTKINFIVEKNKVRLLVVDECSMIGEEDLKEIVKLGRYIPVVFLGDFHQLSPVQKKDGRDIYNKMISFNLTEQHRNAGEVLKLCDSLRHTITFPKESKEGIHVHNSEEEFFERLLNEIKTKEDPWNISYLAYTNKSVNTVRNFIHKELHGNEPFVEGQYLRLESKTIIGNRSEMVEILSVIPKEDTIFKRTEYETTITSYGLKIQNTYSEKITDVTCVSYDDQDVMETFMKDIYNLKKDIYAKKSKFKNKTSSGFIELNDKDKELSGILAEIRSFTFVSSPYALTIHKSQGRSIPTVFLDTRNIDKFSRDQDTKKKLLYVGCSRTKDDLHTIRR